ncbi:L-serine ammonia-lyase [Kineosporia sp. R_H_3]|uniref:L-serine ammonia-lyase n=1 Tax=Kineosporia sp. R_H_3 TaxID=1961848 RepID=UPI000B4C0399|nr:L-serine ammonia-lyase [Kineosporia sp. R_H_3]
MALSVFDLFSVGIGPSSSHTVGPMRAAVLFVDRLRAKGLLDDVTRVRVELYGSLGATGHGHGSPKAVVLGLAGYHPESVDPLAADEHVVKIRDSRRLRLGGGPEIDFDPAEDVVLHRRKSLPAHPNGMTCAAFAADGTQLDLGTYYSVGGGFVVDEAATGADRVVADTTPVRYPFTTGEALLALTTEHSLRISDVMLANEESWRPADEVRAGLLRIWDVMQECVNRGCHADGVLPGGLKVRRRAAELSGQLHRDDEVHAAAHAAHAEHVASGGVHTAAGSPQRDPLHAMDWVNLWALAVNEENAAGGRVVTAPTNGAAGIIPAVLHYYTRFVPGADDDGVVRFLLTAGAIGVLYKENASISGAEVGCQGEVGSACSMAAGGLAEVLGGTPEQVENAAEIGMEHNLGLTCDPVGGLVQIPCIERNAIAAVKAINAARMAVRGDGSHVVSLDKVIKTMRETGADMKIKYKETARGGLAVNVIEC